MSAQDATLRRQIANALGDGLLPLDQTVERLLAVIHQESPRVWLDGDTVPAGVRVMDRYGEIYDEAPEEWPSNERGEWRDKSLGPLVEILSPAQWKSFVDAERERREKTRP